MVQIQADPTVLFSIALALLRLIMFGLAIALTIISFQAYRQHESDRLEYVFIGFAFISMGTALSNVTVRVVVNTTGVVRQVFLIIETLPFIVGFSMLLMSLRT